MTIDTMAVTHGEEPAVLDPTEILVSELDILIPLFWFLRYVPSACSSGHFLDHVACSHLSERASLDAVVGGTSVRHTPATTIEITGVTLPNFYMFASICGRFLLGLWLMSPCWQHSLVIGVGAVT